MIALSPRFRTVSLSGSIALSSPFDAVYGWARWVYVAPEISTEPTWGSVAEDIYTHFRGEFMTLRPTIPIAWDNVPYQPPADAAYVAIRIEPGETRQASISSAPVRWRSHGLVVVEVLTPHGEDSLLAFGIAGDVVGIWRGQTLDSDKIVFTKTETRRVGVNEQQQYQLTVVSEFRFDALI